MTDLFAKEQNVFDQATRHLNEIKNGRPCDSREFALLVKEYGLALRQLRRLTKISDKTTAGLNSSKLALSDEVRYDALTGIFNRRYMDKELNRLINNFSGVDGATLSVMMIDVDYFKKYNDAYGHSMGDECLKAVAGVLQNNLPRDGDFVARYGGEEFAVILPNTDKHGALTVAERLLQEVRAANIPHIKSDVAAHVTFSIGATSGQVYDSASDKVFLQKADEALYLSKQNGRNRCTHLACEGD